MSKRKKNLSAKTPADKLFEDAPEQVREIYRQHKSHRRAKDRQNYIDLMRGKEISE